MCDELEACPICKSDVEIKIAQKHPFGSCATYAGLPVLAFIKCNKCTLCMEQRVSFESKSYSENEEIAKKILTRKWNKRI